MSILRNVDEGIKLDIEEEKKRLITRIKDVARDTTRCIEHYIEEWGEEYASRGRKELERVKKIEEKWIERVRETDELDLNRILFVTHFVTNSIYRCWYLYYTWRRRCPTWRKKRAEIIKQRKKCEICGSTKWLEVHHVKGLSSEKPEDLQLLCRECHNKVTLITCSDEFNNDHNARPFSPSVHSV